MKYISLLTLLLTACIPRYILLNLTIGQCFIYKNSEHYDFIYKVIEVGKYKYRVVVKNEKYDWFDGDGIFKDLVDSYSYTIVECPK